LEPKFPFTHLNFDHDILSEELLVISHGVNCGVYRVLLWSLHDVSIIKPARKDIDRSAFILTKPTSYVD